MLKKIQTWIDRIATGVAAVLLAVNMLEKKQRAGRRAA